jgi:hypothetical protein
LLGCVSLLTDLILGAVLVLLENGLTTILAGSVAHDATSAGVSMVARAID